MRSFWKTNANEGLEIYLREAISKQIRYCHFFSEIPQVCVGQNNTAVEERVFEAARLANTTPMH